MRQLELIFCPQAVPALALSARDNLLHHAQPLTKLLPKRSLCTGMRRAHTSAETCWHRAVGRQRRRRHYSDSDCSSDVYCSSDSYCSSGSISSSSCLASLASLYVFGSLGSARFLCDAEIRLAQLATNCLNRTKRQLLPALHHSSFNFNVQGS